MWYHILRVGLTTCTWCREFRAAVLLHYWSWSQIKHSSGWSAIGARRPSLIPSMIVYARIPIIAPSSQNTPNSNKKTNKHNRLSAGNSTPPRTPLPGETALSSERTRQKRHHLRDCLIKNLPIVKDKMWNLLPRNIHSHQFYKFQWHPHSSAVRVQTMLSPPS